jgi:hypothetical protein
MNWKLNLVSVALPVMMTGLLGSPAWAGANGNACSQLAKLYFNQFQCCISTGPSCRAVREANDGAGCPVLSCQIPPQFEPIVNAFPNDELYVGGLISGLGWVFVLAPDIEPYDPVFLAACAQSNGLDPSGVYWIDDNYVTLLGPVPALCVDITRWDTVTKLHMWVADNPFIDLHGQERDCGVGLDCHTGFCQEGFEYVPCCRMTARCYPPHYRYGDPWSTFSADYHY